jgi:hypothetical protein
VPEGVEVEVEVVEEVVWVEPVDKKAPVNCVVARAVS